MKEVIEGLYVGNELDCRFHNSYDENWVVVHACKSPCHQRAVGYKGSLPGSHPNYLVFKTNSDLYLNLIDPPKPLFMLPSFHSFMAFMRHHWNTKKILIHCNQGESRTPSLALLFLSKHIKTITNSSYHDAKDEFLKIYPEYSPGLGIQIFLQNTWDEI